MTIQVQDIPSSMISDFNFNIEEFSKSLDEYGDTLQNGEYVDPGQFTIRVLKAYGLIGERVPSILLSKMASDIKKTTAYPVVVLNTIEFALCFCVLAKLRSDGVTEDELETLKEKMHENWATVVLLLEQVAETDPSVE